MPDWLQTLLEVQTTQTRIFSEHPPASHYRRRRVRRQACTLSRRPGDDAPRFVETIKPCAVVLSGYDDTAVHGHGCGHIEVSWRWRHELPKAPARHQVPAAQR